MTAPLSILLVTSIADQASAYRRALEDAGFRVTVASTGAEALAAARDAVPACAVIDLRLPDIDGWDLCGRLAQAAGRPSIRLVVLAPEMDGGNARRSAAAGCHAWLTRPSVADDLVRTVRYVNDQELNRPASPHDALLNDLACPACSSHELRATVRISSIVQYYRCRQCGFHWRAEIA